MATALIIGAVVGGAMGLYGAKKQRDAGKAAAGVANINAGYVYDETAEEIERMKKNQERVTAMTIGKQGSSGIQLGAGSTDAYITEMQKAFADDISWVKKAGDSRADIIRRGGEVAKKQSYASSWGTAASAISSMTSYWA